jgi:hypothetical protein
MTWPAMPIRCPSCFQRAELRPLLCERCIARLRAIGCYCDTHHCVTWGLGACLDCAQTTAMRPSVVRTVADVPPAFVSHEIREFVEQFIVRHMQVGERVLRYLVPRGYTIDRFAQYQQASAHSLVIDLRYEQTPVVRFELKPLERSFSIRAYPDGRPLGFPPLDDHLIFGNQGG